MIGNDPGKMASPDLVDLAGQLLVILDEFSAYIAGEIRERDDREADISAAQAPGGAGCPAAVGDERVSRHVSA